MINTLINKNSERKKKPNFNVNEKFNKGIQRFIIISIINHKTKTEKILINEN